MKDELLALPQDEDVWIAGAQPMTVRAAADGVEHPVWLLLVQSRTQYVVLAVHIGKVQPKVRQTGR